MIPLHLFHFTPSMMSAETLERIFVQRVDLANRLTDLVRESVLTESKYHTLLIGPRGIGKTHLIAMSYHRVRAMNDISDCVRLAWLREEEWGVDSFLDLILRICRSLQAEYADDFPSDEIESLYQLQPDKAEHESLEILKAFVGNKTLLLFVENLDDLFRGLQDKGQRRFRGFIQENPFISILATSQSLFNGVSRQNAPFYGFFRVLPLEEFSVDDAAELLKNIAQLKGDPQLANFIETPSGRARVRTVNHLAGGNPRVYVIFSEFLTRESLDDLVGPFLNTLDELTPYYQSRIASLSIQQRKIIELLCDKATPTTVKELARRCFISQQTVSSQLVDLKEKGYVQSNPVGMTGKETYYELKEPLMRLCMEVKKSHNGPIRLLIDFLRLWYPVTELRHQLDMCRSESTVERDYLSTAIELSEKDGENPVIHECDREFDRYMAHQDYLNALKVADELVAIAPDERTYSNRSLVHFLIGDVATALRDVDQALELNPAFTSARVNRIAYLDASGRTEDALSSALTLVEIEPASSSAWHRLAHAYMSSSMPNDALIAIEKQISLDPRNAMAWYLKGKICDELGEYKEAMRSLAISIKFNPGNIGAWHDRADLQFRSGKFERALATTDRALRKHPNEASLWFDKGSLLILSRRAALALPCYDRAIEMGASSECTYFGRAEALVSLGRTEDATSDLRIALKTFADSSSGGLDHVISHTVFLVRGLLNSPIQSDGFSKEAGIILREYSAAGFEAAVGPSLLACLRELLSDGVSLSAAVAWYDAWMSAYRSISGEPDLPLNILKTAVRYKESGNKRVLLDLPIEQRKILTSMLERDATTTRI